MNSISTSITKNNSDLGSTTFSARVQDINSNNPNGINASAVSTPRIINSINGLGSNSGGTNSTEGKKGGFNEADLESRYGTRAEINIIKVNIDGDTRTTNEFITLSNNLTGDSSLASRTQSDSTGNTKTSFSISNNNITDNTTLTASRNYSDYETGRTYSIGGSFTDSDNNNIAVQYGQNLTDENKLAYDLGASRKVQNGDITQGISLGAGTESINGLLNITQIDPVYGEINTRVGANLNSSFGNNSIGIIANWNSNSDLNSSYGVDYLYNNTDDNTAIGLGYSINTNGSNEIRALLRRNINDISQISAIIIHKPDGTSFSLSTQTQINNFINLGLSASTNSSGDYNGLFRIEILH